MQINKFKDRKHFCLAPSGIESKLKVNQKLRKQYLFRRIFSKSYNFCSHPSYYLKMNLDKYSYINLPTNSAGRIALKIGKKLLI